MSADSVRDQVFLDIFTTALEGGINYWAECSEYHWLIGNGTVEDYEGFFAIVNDVEDGEAKQYRIDRSVISKGYALATGPKGKERLGWSTERPPLIPSEDWDYDAGDADIIVQLGLFGEVWYG